MKQADVIVLNEVDWGLKRTDYRSVAADLASALGMNYAYGVEFVEVDPIALGVEQFEELSLEDSTELTKELTVDPARYRGCIFSGPMVWTNQEALTMAGQIVS